MAFYCFVFDFNVSICSKIYKRESFPVVIVGGKHVHTSLVLMLFVKRTHSSQLRVFIISLICLQEILNSYNVGGSI